MKKIIILISLLVVLVATLNASERSFKHQNSYQKVETIYNNATKGQIVVGVIMAVAGFSTGYILIPLIGTAVLVSSFIACEIAERKLIGKNPKI